MLRSSENNIVKEEASIREGLELLEKANLKILLVVDEANKFRGTCTDGDIRRHILRSGSSRGIMRDVMNPEPAYLSPDFNRGEVATFLRKHNVHYAPVIAEDGTISGLVSADDHFAVATMNVPVVLMAGGLGSRLMPLTENCPKPLLPIGDKPIIEHIMDRFIAQGFSRFFISVNYLGHMIEEYFGSGKRLGVKIDYLRENRRLGTGGALDLLPKNMDEPFIVMNSDLITEIDFRDLVAHHRETEAAATMCVREHLTSIPFGVVQFDGSVYKGVSEKPSLKHHINAGIYCLSRAAKEVVPHDEFYDMPTLFSDLQERGRKCSVHVVHDRWIDIGSRDQYDRAKKALG